MTPIIPEAKLHAAFSVFLQSKNNITFDKPIQRINVPVNGVVVKGFFPPFFAAVVAGSKDINASPRGCGGVSPGGAGVRPTCQVYHWIDRHCEIRHIVVNHCSNTVQELQRWKMSFHAAVDGINDELTLSAMQNVCFFPMQGVSEMPEWSIIRLRWTNRRLGQYAGKWSSCEGFFPPFFCARGWESLSQRCVATRGCRGTAVRF